VERKSRHPKNLRWNNFQGRAGERSLGKNEKENQFYKKRTHKQDPKAAKFEEETFSEQKCLWVCL